MPGKDAALSPKKKRSPRLGRGLSSLMAAPVAVQPSAAAETPLGHRPPVGGVGEVGTPLSARTSAASVSGSQTVADADGLPNQGQANETDGLHHLPVDEVTPNRSQPRQRFDPAALRGLADSIQREGLMQPVIVRPAAQTEVSGGRAYELVAGERRWRAAKLAGLTTIPAFVRELDDQQLAEWALIENVQREDLNPIEKAQAIERLIQTFQLSQQAVGERLGIDRAHVSNLLRLLTLSDQVRGMAADGLLSMGQARALVGLSDPSAQELMAKRVVKQGMSVRQVEAAVRKLLQGSVPAAKPARGRQQAAHLADLGRQLTEQLGTRVELRPGKKKNSGSLVIEYYDLEQFDALMGRLNVSVE